MLFTTLSVMLPFLTFAVGSPVEERDTCNRDNVLRCLVSASATATPYCSSYLGKGVVTSYSATTTPTTTATTTVTITVTSPAVAKRDFEAATTIYAGSPVTIAGPDTTSVVLNRRMVEARATTAPAPSCLAQYSPAATRLTSACNCLSITSSTLTTVSTAPTTTTTSTVTATSTVAPKSPCPRCNVCSSNADCQPGYECDQYINFSFGDVSLCTTNDIQSSSDICSSICT